MAAARVTAAVTTILIARHGETDWNRERRFQGHADPPLNEVGREQAGQLARELAGSEVTAVYASPLARARETAEIVAAALALPVETRDALREVDVGSWQGLTRDEIEERFPTGFRRWLVDFSHGWDGGESYDELGRRVVADLLELAERHPDERVLVVTHGGPMRAAQAAAADAEYAEVRRVAGPIGNCAVLVFAVESERLRRVDSDR
jgi:2,3-bisphosphoglycerate-dependent phosphoglycerate mutase